MGGEKAQSDPFPKPCLTGRELMHLIYLQDLVFLSQARMSALPGKPGMRFPPVSRKGLVSAKLSFGGPPMQWALNWVIAQF